MCIIFLFLEKIIQINIQDARCAFLQLVAVLREVKYLEVRGEEEIPQSASEIYGRNETLRMYVANLDLTVQWYNKVRETILEVEYPLIESQLEDIDQQLQRAENDLSWNSDSRDSLTQYLV